MRLTVYLDSPSFELLLRGESTYNEPRAHELRARYVATFGGADLPVPVEALAEDLLGLHVSEADLDGISGLLYPARRRIVINAADPPARKRFTVAHELGHWICQCQDGPEAEVYCRAEDVTLNPGARAVEREANIFAAELLMPEQAVRRSWAGDADECATHFGVSGEAMRWRLYSFGLSASPKP
jgi:Zn-dependent peptidase ImmA (M78 family)